MSDSAARQCLALTRSGRQCKNNAPAGGKYCHVHQGQATVQAAAEVSSAAGSQPEFRDLVSELNDLAEELRRMIPEYSPPPFSQEGLLRLLRDNIDRMTPEMRLGLLRDLQAGLQGTSARDFFDPDTWKGLWYLLNYSLQSEVAAIREKLAGRLAEMPGKAALSDLQGMLQGSSPRDLLEIETWKGMWYLLNYTVQGRVEEVRRRVRGEPES